MKEILSIILMLFVLYFMYLGAKSRTNEIKEKREQLRQEGNLASPKVGLIRVLKVLGFMVGSSLIITTIILYTREIEFLAYNIFCGIFTIFIFESIIGSQVGFVQEVIKIYKKNGLKITVLAVIFTICWVVSLIYVRYGH